MSCKCDEIATPSHRAYVKAEEAIDALSALYAERNEKRPVDTLDKALLEAHHRLAVVALLLRHDYPNLVEDE